MIVLSTTPATGNVDTIQNFSVADDTIQLLRTVFAALPGTGPGPVDAVAFWTGTTAHDADDRIIFDSATGKLWYDADGTGHGGGADRRVGGGGGDCDICRFCGGVAWGTKSVGSELATAGSL